jgi:hypothetical protein
MYYFVFRKVTVLPGTRKTPVVPGPKKLTVLPDPTQKGFPGLASRSSTVSKAKGGKAPVAVKPRWH